MNSRQIEKILERYFNGETSLDEEQKLKKFFSAEDIPHHLKSLQAQFEYFSNEKEKEYLNENFDNKVLDQIYYDIKRHQRNTRRRYLYVASGIAASIFIILSIFFKFDPLSNKVEDTFKDPMSAYFETRKAFLFISDKLNKGVDPIEKVSKLDDGIQQFSKISSLSTGIEEVNKISKLYENQQKILNQ